MAGAKQVSISADMLKDHAAKITQIDSQIAAATGNDASVRKAVIEELATANSDQVNSVAGKIVEQLKKLDPAVLVGLQARVEEAFSGELKALTDDVINSKMKEKVGEGVDVNALKETRKAELDAFKALKTILDSVGIDTSDVPEPKRSGGRSSGGGTVKSGKNKEGYRFTLDGKDRPDSQNSFSSLAFYATEGLKVDPSTGDVVVREKGDEGKLGSKELKELLAKNGIKFGEQDEWSLTLPNGKVIGARREAAAATDTPAETPAADGTTPPATESATTNA